MDWTGVTKVSLKRSRGSLAEVVVTAAHAIVIVLLTLDLTGARLDGAVWKVQMGELAVTPSVTEENRGGGHMMKVSRKRAEREKERARDLTFLHRLAESSR